MLEDFLLIIIFVIIYYDKYFWISILIIFNYKVANFILFLLRQGSFFIINEI